jgi:hypothetical protein
MRGITLTVALTFLCGCAAAQTAAGQPAANTVSNPVVLSCTPAGNASPSWPQPDVASGSPAIVAAVVTGDTLKLTFAAGTPEYEVVPQASAQFVADASGRPVQLPATAGVRIILRGFRGDMSNYGGQNDLTSSGLLLLQASKIGDFEGVVSFAAGTSAPACANVASHESSLTFRFIAAPQPVFL